MPLNRDAIGARGEAIVSNLLTRFHGRREPFFRPQFMGDKYPTVDFFVELVGARGTQIPFFLAQVKTTTRGYSETIPRRLRAQVSRAAMSNLVKYPAPTYVIGVDEQGEEGFIMAALVGGRAQLSSFPTAYSLAKKDTLEALYDEVLAFWVGNPVSFASSRFV